MEMPSALLSASRVATVMLNAAVTALNVSGMFTVAASEAFTRSGCGLMITETSTGETER